MTSRRLAVAAALLLVVCGALLITARHLSPGQSGTRTPSLTTVTEAAPSPSKEGSRLIIESVGLDVPLSAMTASRHLIDPPIIDAAYVIANIGVSPSHHAQGTVYIAMHALPDGQHGPGNTLIDPTSRTILVTPGDTILADGTAYTVITVTTQSKATTSQDAQLWNPNTPDRLILITCLPTPTGETATHNIIISAEIQQP